MTKNEEWLDEKFHELRSRSASCSKLFSDELEERIMNERRTVTSSRRKMWTVALALLTIGAAGGTYASSEALKQWFFGPFHADADGIIRDAEGNKIGENQVLEDGSEIATIQVDGVQIVTDGHLPEGEFKFSFEPTAETDGKTPDSAGKTGDK